MLRPIPGLEGKKGRVLVVGLGISGHRTARWLAARGADVTVSDMRPARDLDPAVMDELEKMGVILETGGHREETFLAADMIILSPGVPADMPVVRASRARGATVTGELEFAGRLVDTPVIAVTGTNGKTTVTTFLGRMLREAGHRVFVGGNIGTPLMAYAAGKRDADYAVVEVSSFQLDTIETFRPRVSVVLNISPDHLDRYPDYAAYARSKLRIFENQGPGDVAVLNDDDDILKRAAPPPGVTVLRYGRREREGLHAFFEGDRIRAGTGARRTFSVRSFRLPGSHNRENLLPAVLAGMALGVDPGAIQATIDTFKGLPHRLEAVGERSGVLFYDDSKATNVDAAVKAVRSFDRPVVLIAGGRHKGSDYGPLAAAAEGRVKQAVFIGEAAALLGGAFRDRIPYRTAVTMEEAVAFSFAAAREGEVVLLAPACSSFDMFTDYAHRGRVFRAAVEALEDG